MKDLRSGMHYSFDPIRGKYRRPTWPEEIDKQDKQMHFEIGCDDFAAGVAFAIECGATLSAHQGRKDLRVMLDPAGHPFCLGEHEEGFSANKKPLSEECAPWDSNPEPAD